MKKLPLSILIFTLTWYHSLSEDDKTIEKRQSCSGGNCGGTVGGLSRSFVEYTPPIPCPGGNCGGNGGSGGGDFINYVPPRPCVGGNCGGNGGSNGGGFINYVPPRPCVGGNCGGNGGHVIPDYRPPCPGGNCGGNNGGYVIPDYRPPCPGGNCGGYRPCSGRNCEYGEGNSFDARYVDQSWISGSCLGGNCRERQNNCCYVMHPRQCFTDENGDKRCQVRRHRECSDLCTSSVVSIQEGRGNTERGCHYIQNYPYAYCGNYERHDCGQCYTCGGRYQPSECQRRTECPDGCRI